MVFVKVPPPETPFTTYKVVPEVCLKRAKEGYEQLAQEGIYISYNHSEVVLHKVMVEGVSVLRGECPECGTTHWSGRQ